MTQREALISWRLFELNWMLLGVLLVALLISLALTDFTIGFVGAAVTGAYVALYAGVAYYNAKAPHRQDPQVVFTLGAFAQIVLCTGLLTPLTYVAASFNFPMQDANLYAIDRAFGIDGRDYLAFVNEHPLLATWLQTGYRMIRWPIFGIPVILAIAYRFRRMQEYMMAFTLALTVTTIISTFVPALGIFSLLGEKFPNISTVVYESSLPQMSEVRDGSLRHLEMLGLTGLVTFPSFHAASAVLYLWALWPVRWFRPIALVANVLMLASCPLDGAHYFIDVAAGIAVAMLAIAAARQVSLRVAARIPEERAQSATADAPIPAQTPARAAA